MNTNANLSKLLSAAQLPALPHSAVLLLQLSQDPRNGPVEFALPIESDPGLTTQVLRFVNSSYFGFRQEISSVRVAISMVGIRTIQNFLLWSAVFSLLPNPRCGPFNLRNLWQDSLRRGIFARNLARRLKLAQAEDLFAMALLQDMAVPLLAKSLPEEYQTLILARDGGQHRLSDLEQEQLGWTHAEAGGMLARHWSLPAGFASVIENHSNSLANASEASDSNGFLVGLSALLPSVCDPHWSEREVFHAAFDRLPAGPEAGIDTLFARVDQEYENFAPVLQIAQPARSLASYLQPEPVAV